SASRRLSLTRTCSAPKHGPTELHQYLGAWPVVAPRVVLRGARVRKRLKALRAQAEHRDSNGRDGMTLPLASPHSAHEHQESGLVAHDGDMPLVPLRGLAIASNVLFILYGIAGQLYPVLLLHAVLLPVNVVKIVPSAAASATRQWQQDKGGPAAPRRAVTRLETSRWVPMMDGTSRLLPVPSQRAHVCADWCRKFHPFFTKFFR